MEPNAQLYRHMDVGIMSFERYCIFFSKGVAFRQDNNK